MEQESFLRQQEHFRFDLGTQIEGDFLDEKIEDGVDGDWLRKAVKSENRFGKITIVLGLPNRVVR